MDLLSAAAAVMGHYGGKGRARRLTKEQLSAIGKLGAARRAYLRPVQQAKRDARAARREEEVCKAKAQVA